MSTLVDWPSGDSALAQAVRWIGEHGGDISWVVDTGAYVFSDGTKVWTASPKEMDFRGISGLLELGAFGFYVSIEPEDHRVVSVVVRSEQNEMCKLIAVSKDERRVEAEARLFAIRKLADTAINREKERMQLERVEKLIEQVRIFKMDR